MSIIKEQNFGIEIELTGITRAQAAEIIANYYGNHSHFIGTYYNTYGATDSKGRVWKAMSDASINCQKRTNGRLGCASSAYSCEVVSPILRYDDIADLQNIVRKLREAGAIANSSCGIHVHVDGANHDANSLTRLTNFFIGRQDLFYEALNIGDRADRWCHKISAPLFKAMKSDKERSRSSMEKIWYSPANDGYDGGVSNQHYNSTRYHGLNLHAYFTKGTVEFRLFNGTTHAGKIKAYIQFCLAMSAWAIESTDNIRFVKRTGMTQEQKRKLMHNVLTNRLGMTGNEFKTARLHLEAAFETQNQAIA